MMREDAASGAFNDEAKTLETRLREILELSEKAAACVVTRPADAFQLYSQVLRDWNGFCEAQEDSLQRMIRETQRQLSEFQASAVERRLHWLYSMSQAAFLLDDLRGAREALTQALGIIGDKADPLRPVLRQSLLNIAEREVDLGTTHTYESLLAQYEDIYQEYLSYEQWDEAAQLKERMAIWASKCDRRAECVRFYGEAIALAESHQLTERAERMRLRHLQLNSAFLNETPLPPENAASFSPVSGEDETIRRVDELIFDAGCHLQRKDYDSAIESLGEALKKACRRTVARRLVEKRYNIHHVLADAYEGLESTAQALKHADKALRMARASGVRMEIVRSLMKVIPMRLAGDAAQRERAAAELQELEQADLLDDFALSLLNRITEDLLNHRPEQVLANLPLAERCARSGYIRRLVANCKVAALSQQERYADALDAIRQALALYDEAARLDLSQPFHLWRDVLTDIATLHTKAAQLETLSGHAREAFVWFENGRARSLRYQLTRAGLAGDMSSLSDLTSFEEAQLWLDGEGVSVLVFGVLGKGTVAILLTPQAEPQAFVLPLTAGELGEMLPVEDLAPGSQSWTDRIFAAVPQLSEKLLHPIANELSDCASRSRALYLIPDQALYLVPFAALTLKDGRTLIEHCPVAFTPSLRVLQLIHARRAQTAEQKCLAVGVGTAERGADASQVISFAEQAEAVGRLPWAFAKVLGDETTAEQFLAEAPGYSILHLSCHGVIAQDSSDALSASQLQFKERNLTAQEVFALGGRLNAKLVFMNACQSGRFRANTGSEVEGFLRGFIHAGAATVIAPLIHVDAREARELALEFYTQWLTNSVSKAEALRLAQLRLMRNRSGQHHWAAYVLYGDHH